MRKRWRWSLIALASAGTGMGALWAPEDPGLAVVSMEPRARAAIPTQEARQAQTTARAGTGPLALPARQDMGRARKNPFEPRSWRPPPPAPASAAEVAPSAPPNPYRFAGVARYDDTTRFLLERGDRLVEANAGEVLDGVYSVRSASAEGVTLVYVPLGIEQPLAAAAAPILSANPAQASAAPAPLSAAPAPPAATAAQFPPGSPLVQR